MKIRGSKHKVSGETTAVKRKRLLNNDSPFAVKEAYVKLRTNLMFCMTDDSHRNCKVFAVTSSKASEGKSINAANIAISFAMLGERTLLIDADMRKPMQGRLWKADVKAGLCDHLAGIMPLQLTQVKDLPLSIICMGTIPPNPSELLSSDRMKKFVEECAASYDYVIIDTPPINTVADAQIISPLVDGVVVVARSGVTTADELHTAIESVQRVGGNLCGVVLNGVSMKSIKYSYRYKASEGYGYGYGYSYTEPYESK